ncbi:MAG: hypothetical protein WEB31_00575 [Chthoniobacterales bacterium]
MRRFTATILLFGLFSSAGLANVVRGAPEFTWLSSGARGQTLKSVRGQPVVLIVAQSPVQRIFRAQVGQLQKAYQLLGNERALAVAAFTQQPGLIKSNIPFVLAANPAAVAGAYGVTGPFAIFIIGKDGNIDALSDRVMSGQRILDVMNNSFVVQRDNRKSE